MARLAKDLEAHKSDLNLTIVGVNTTLGANEKGIRKEIEDHKLKPFSHVLDHTGVICGEYGVKWKDLYTLVVVDADGKVLGKKPNMDNLPAAKGILADVKVPSGAEAAARMFSLQQFGLMEQELAKVPPSADLKAFREALKKKNDDYTSKRLPQLTALGETNPLTAYHEAAAFVTSFPTSKEASAARSLASRLSSKPEVKKETEAETAYNQFVAPEVVKATTLPVYEKKVKPLVDGYMTRYGDTKFGGAVKTLHEAILKSLKGIKD